MGVRCPSEFIVLYDVLETDSGELILIEASVTLLKSDEGGREHPITDRYRPNHNFDFPDQNRMFIGQFDMSENEWIYPGETNLVTISFLNSIGLREKLIPNCEWKLQEGTHIVGKAVLSFVLIST